MSGAAVEVILDTLRRRGIEYRQQGREIRTLCPVHGDVTPSLDIADGDRGALIRCRSHDCDVSEIVAAWGLPYSAVFNTPKVPAQRGVGAPDTWMPCQGKRSEPGGCPGHKVAEYRYTDEAGEFLFAVARCSRKGEGCPRPFAQWRHDGSKRSGRAWNRRGVRWVVYRLPEVIATAADGGTIYIVEGEKDVEAVRSLDQTATCGPMGAGKWRGEYAAWFKGADAVIVADRDTAGLAHARSVAASLDGIAASLRIVWASVVRKGADVTDHLAAGFALDQLEDVPSAELYPTPDKAGLPRPSAGAAATIPVTPVAAHPITMATPGLIPDSLTDRGNAKLFAAFYGGAFRYVPMIGWHRWTGYRWERDAESVYVREAASELAERYAVEDPSRVLDAKDLLRHRLSSMSSRGRNATLSMAETMPVFVLQADRLDADPYALCTPDGVVDLRTGMLTESDPEQCHTRSALCGPAQVLTPRWDSFLRETFGAGNEGAAVMRFVQEVAGYSMTGDVGGQILPFLYGSGQNGKSVFLDVLLKVMGDYADAAPPGFLMAKQHGEHPTELADLQGRRLIVCAELNEGDKFNEARVKLLTGGDRIKARRMGQDYYSFAPTHHLWLMGNNRPEVASGGYSFWRRMRLIPFDHTVPADRRIDGLAQILVDEEGPGIMAWLVAGAVRYFAGECDLAGPRRVQVATKDYAADEDTFGRFLSECCRIADSPAERTQLRAFQPALGQRYAAWCKDEGVTPLSARKLADKMRTVLGIRPGETLPNVRGVKYYAGIELVTPSEDAES